MHQLLLQAAGEMAPEWVQKVGILGLMVLAVKYLYGELKAQKQELKDMSAKHEADMLASNQKLENYMKEDQAILREALNNNTTVMRQIQEHLNAAK